jgi:membrane protein implicated in regulation of membrane protease activity
MDGRRRGQQAAALDATGAALGSFGLLAFAASFYSLIGRSITGAFLTAALVWLIASVAGWRARRSLRTVQRISGAAHEHARGHTRDA